MIHRAGSFAYAGRKGVRPVELPYDGAELAMVVLLPGAGSLEAFESAVDEEGTEAAAATSAVMVPSMAPREMSIDFRVDHPFLFVIRDTQTGALLSMGRVLELGGS